MINVFTSVWDKDIGGPGEVRYVVDAEEITLTDTEGGVPSLLLTDENGILVAVFRDWTRAGHLGLLSDGVRDTGDAGSADVDQ